MCVSEAKVDFADCLGIKALGSKVWLRDYEGSRRNLGRIFTLSPLPLFEEDNYLYGELPGLGSHLFVHVCTAPTTESPCCLLGNLWDSCTVLCWCSGKNPPQHSFPCERFFMWVFSFPPGLWAWFYPIKGDLNSPVLSFFSVFVWVSIPHARAWVEPLPDSVSVGCWPCQSSDHSQILVQGSELVSLSPSCLLVLNTGAAL